MLLARVEIFVHQYPATPEHSLQTCSQSAHHPVCVRVLDCPKLGPAGHFKKIS